MTVADVFDAVFGGLVHPDVDMVDHDRLVIIERREEMEEGDRL